MQLIKACMSSGHEAQLYKLEEKLGGKIDKCVGYYKQWWKH